MFHIQTKCCYSTIVVFVRLLLMLTENRVTSLKENLTSIKMLVLGAN